MNDIQAIIFDLDGTAIANDPKAMPTERMIETVKKAQTKLRVSAATGRPKSNGLPVIKALGVTHPSAIAAGTQVIDPDTEEILWEATIHHETANKILKIAQPYHYEVCIADEVVGSGLPAMNRPILDDHVNVMYIMYVQPADALALQKELEKLEDIVVSHVKSWSGDAFDLHITHIEATKQHAVEHILQLQGVDPKHAVAIGDANNDIHLFRAVGHKVAMGNATEELKAAADQVIDTVDNEGLAKFIDSLL